MGERVGLLAMLWLCVYDTALERCLSQKKRNSRLSARRPSPASLQYMYGPPVHQELMRQPQQDPSGGHAPQEAAVHNGGAPNGAHAMPLAPQPMQQQPMQQALAQQQQQQQAMPQQPPPQQQQQQPNGGAEPRPFSGPPGQDPNGAAPPQGYPYPPLGQPYGGSVVPQPGYYGVGAYQDRPVAMWQGPGGGAPFAQQQQQQRPPWGGYYYGQQGIQAGSAPAPPARSPEQPQ